MFHHGTMEPWNHGKSRSSLVRVPVDASVFQMTMGCWHGEKKSSGPASRTSIAKGVSFERFGMDNYDCEAHQSVIYTHTCPGTVYILRYSAVYRRYYFFPRAVVNMSRLLWRKLLMLDCNSLKERKELLDKFNTAFERAS